MGFAQKILLLVIFTLPIQLNKYIFTENSYVFGIPIDYLAISVYFTDLLLITYIFTSFIFLAKNPKSFIKHFNSNKTFFVLLLIFNLYFLISMATLNNVSSAVLVRNFKILEFSLFLYFATHDFNSEKLFQKLKYPIAASVLLEFLIVVYQFTRQSSFGLWFLGERSFDITTSAIAHSYIFDVQLLRPYGTFPHPNVLAAFLLVYQLIYLIINGKIEIKKNFLDKIFFSTSLISIFLTFSKTAIFLELILILFVVRKIKTTILLIPPLLYVLYSSTKQTLFVNSVAERITLMEAALDISLLNPLFGVGTNNFISELAQKNIVSIGEVRLLQPVHNVFLLILSENGLIGFLIFFILLTVAQKRAYSLWRMLLLSFLIVYLLVDHFLWTLHQGLFLLFFALTVLLQKAKKVRA